MEAHIKAINSLVSPAEAACEFDLRPRVENDACVIDCPNCGKPMFVLDGGFVCASHNCNFKAGGVIDIIALMEKVRINRACAYFFEAFEHRAKKISRYKDTEFMNELATHIKQRRKLLEFFLRRRNTEPKKVYEIQAISALSKAGINLSDNKLTGAVLSHEDMYELDSILKYFNAELPDVPASTAVLAVPYYSNHHTIDSLTLSTPAKPTRSHKIVDIERNARITWGGLLQAHPATKDVELAESAVDMLVTNSSHARTGTGREIAMHCRYKGSAADILWKPATATYVLADNSEVDPVISLTRLEACLPGMQLRIRGVELPVREYVMESCIASLLKDGFTPKTKLILEAAQLDEKDRHALLSKLHDARAYGAAEQVRKFLRVVLVHKDDKGLLYSTPDGYLTARDDAADKVPVTNFTLDIINNIVFPDSQDVFHAAALTVGETSRNIVLRPTDIDRVVDLETAVRFASGGADENRLPTVRDKSCGRIISAYLRYKISEAPKVEGIPFIGWNEKKTRFYGPYWYADKKLGCVQYDAVLHPFNPDMKYYSNKPFTTRSLHQDLPAAAKTLLAQFVSVLTRQYLGLPAHGLVYFDDEDHRYALTAMFAAIGQIHPYEYTAINSRLNHSGNLGASAVGKIPKLVSSRDGAALVRRQSSIGVTNMSPIYGFADKGSKLAGIGDVKIFENSFKSTTVHMVFETLTWILRTEAKSFKRADSVSLAQSCEIEGNNIICEIFGLDAWNTRTSEYSTLEAFLAAICYEEVNKYVSHNINDHVVTLDLASRPEIDPVAVARELEKLGADSVFLDGSKVTADATSMMAALELYYHNKPTVEEEFDPDALMELPDT